MMEDFLSSLSLPVIYHQYIYIYINISIFNEVEHSAWLASILKNPLHSIIWLTLIYFHYHELLYLISSFMQPIECLKGNCGILRN